MFFLKSGELYWDGAKFQPDYREGIVFAALMGVGKDIRRASALDPNCRVIALTDAQWTEYNSRNDANRS
jgi:hypothetical protein